MRAALWSVGLAALLGLLVLGIYGTLFGGLLAAREVQRLPAALVAVALMVLSRGAAALPGAAGWALLGAAGAVVLRQATGSLGENGWIPGEDITTPEILAEAGWLTLLAVLAWLGAAPRAMGPLLAAVVATTRLGGYGQALVPVLWEDTLRDALLVAANILAGFAAGVIVVLLGGWCAAILARPCARWVAPGRVIAALAAAAAIGHMLLL